MTVTEAYELWQNEYWTVDGNLLENTIRSFISIYNKHILPLIGNNDIDNIDFDKLQDYYNRLRNDGLSPKTIRNIQESLESLVKWCYKRNIILTYPKFYIVLPKRRGQNIIYNHMTEKEFEILLPYLQGHYKYAIMFYAATGIRLEEIAIKKENIDFNNNLLYIKTAVKRKYIDYKSRKTTLVLSKYLKSSATYRSIPITPDVRHIIDCQLKFLKFKNIDTDLLFCNTQGDLIDTRNLLRAFHTALTHAGLPKRGINSLRKLYIRCMVQNEMRPKTLQK